MITLALLLMTQEPAAVAPTEPVVPEPVAAPTPAADPIPAAPLSPPPPAPVAPSESRPPQAEAASAPGKFVFAWLPSVFMGISWPSFAPATFFFGGRLSRSWALGYQLTGSFGLAERYLSGLLAHRHHLTALHGFGATRRGLVGVGAGVAFNLPLLPVVEVEGRVGFRFGDTRRWVVGALARLGWDIGHQERAPMPQFGLFIGFTTL